MRIEKWDFSLDTWSDLVFEDLDQATGYAERAWSSSRELGHPPEIYAVALTITAANSSVSGDFDRSERTYLEGLAAFDSIPREPRNPILIAEADHLRNFAYLRAKQHRYEDAFGLVDQADLIYAVWGDDHGFGRSLLARGTILLMKDDPAAVFSLSAALRYLDTERWRQCLPAVFNLINALTRFTEFDPSTLEAALNLLVEARLSLRSSRREPATRYLRGRRRRTPPDAFLRYLQGRILVLLGEHDLARSLLESAREDFLHLKMFREAAFTGLEIAECDLWLSGKHRWNRILTLCTQVLAMLRSEPDCADAVAAYRLLELAARERSLNGLKSAVAQSRELFSLTE